MRASSDRHVEQAMQGADSLQWVGRIQDTFVPASEIQARIACFQESLARASLDAALIKQNADLYYLSGTIQDSYLLVPRQGEPLLMVYRNRQRASMESPIEKVTSLPSLKRLPQVIQDHGYPLPSTLGLELDVLPATLYLRLRELLPETSFKDVSLLLREQRKIKSPYEVSLLRKAGSVADRIYRKAHTVFREGVTEVEASGLLEAEARKWGHQGYIRMRGFNQEMFYGHVISGPEAVPASALDAPTGGLGLSTAFSHGPSNKPLRKGEPIIVDLMGCFNGYIADQTRCFCLGPPGATLKEAYEVTREILDALKGMLRPGIPTSRLYHKAHEIAAHRGYGEVFMGLPGSAPKFMGHGVGLEVDEFPFVTAGNHAPLEAGMVVALEPKIFLPDLGVVGIEDTVLVTDQGPEELTVSDRDLAILACS